MKSTSFIKSLFYFSKEQRIGILVLFFVIVILQITFCVTDFNQPHHISLEEKQWISLGKKSKAISDSDSAPNYKVYPFNPNFITDYKGYKLGMSVQEIDRLHRYRAQNKYVNSAAEFQKVTKVSSDLLQKISPYFKFPDWVTNKSVTSYKKFQTYPTKEKVAIIQKDINAATKEDLIAVYGIGEKTAEKILIEKEKFGAFVSMEQFQFIWGISPEAIEDLQKRFFVKNTSTITKIAINELSIKELAKFPYFNYALAKEIVIYRSMNNGIKEIADLTKIKGMPNEKIKIIALYLEF